MTEEELQVKFAENRAKREQRNAKFKLTIEKRDTQNYRF